MKGITWTALIAAGLLGGTMAAAQTSSPQQTTTTQSTTSQAGVSATASPGAVSGTVSGTALPEATSTASQDSAQSSSQPAAPSQGANPQGSAPQSSTTYTTTTQTTVPQSAQPANSATQSGTTSSSTATTGVPGTVASTGQPEILIDPGKIYNDKQPISWVGKPVILQNVMVQDTNDTGNFWVGSDGHHRLLIVKQDNNPNLKAMRFHKGDIVTIQGTIQPASKYMAQQTTASDNSMHDAEKSSGVFLLADNVTVASSTHK